MPQPATTYRNCTTYQPYTSYIRLLFALLFFFIGTYVYAHTAIERHILVGDKGCSPQQLVNKQNQMARAKSYDFFSLLDSTSLVVYGISPPQPTARTICKRGFTGHEHLNIFGLIDMKGRMYDPQLGRFLSPDPYVQMPDYSQNFNRYSYCLNNPLKYVDPDGVTLPKGAYVPNNLIENPYRKGSYGLLKDGKFAEKLRVDIGTLPGYKGPNNSHFHLNGGKKHIFDLEKWPWWR